MKDYEIKFDHLKKYISFLYPEYLDEMVKVNIERAKQLNVPLLKVLQHLSPEELHELQKNSMEEYLKQILEDKAIEAVRGTMVKWKANLLPGIPKEKVVASDITLVYNARKFVLNKFLPLYTNDSQEILKIINELEDFYTYQETIAIETFTEIQHEEIAKRESLLKQSQEMAHLGNWEYDYTKKKIIWSDEMYRIYGLPFNTEPDITTLQKLVNKEDLEDYNRILSQIWETGGSFSVQYKIKRSDQEDRIISEQGTLIKGDRTVLRGISQDITELKKKEEELRESYIQLQNFNEELQRAEEALKEANLWLEQKVEERTEELLERNEELKKTNDELLKINRDLDNFVYTASHDLKAPVANIEGLMTELTSMINDSVCEKDDINTIISLIKKSTEKFKKTIQYLADVAKVQKDVDGEISEIDICDVIDDIEESIRKEIDHAKANITVDTSKCPIIEFSRKNIYSIIYNILANSIKYRSPERDPDISISTERADGYVLITIKDNGLGIEKDKVDQIFTMFKRLHTHVEGTGLGLYIVKRIIENNEGKIEVDSEPGKGTTFRIFLKTDIS